MRTVNRSMIVLLSAGLVAACGGGSGGGGETGASVRAPLAINAGNGVRLAKDVVAGSELVSGSGNATVFTAAANTDREIPRLRALTYGLALEQLNADIATSPAITLAATVTENCRGGGTRTVTATDKNSNSRFDAGDSGNITYNNCAEAGVVQNGTLGFDVIALQGNPDSTSTNWSFSFVFRFDNLSFRSGAEGFTLDGGYNLAASYKASNGVYRFVTAGSSLSFASDADTAQVLNFNFTEILASASSRRQLSYNYTHDNSDFAGSATVVTNVPFRGW